MGQKDAKQFPGIPLPAKEKNTHRSCIYQPQRPNTPIAHHGPRFPYLAKIAIRLLAAVVLVNDRPRSLEPISIPSLVGARGLGIMRLRQTSSFLHCN
ncbi:MAG: hypothetical protein BGO12_05365 [Verrucomicrobia bacterium 61-8]|nr:MAG: hypothetical protein BGO12_05365 [Verrucomicrobia bacterium 61-8]